MLGLNQGMHPHRGLPKLCYFASEGSLQITIRFETPMKAQGHLKGDAEEDGRKISITISTRSPEPISTMPPRRIKACRLPRPQRWQFCKRRPHKQRRSRVQRTTRMPGNCSPTWSITVIGSQNSVMINDHGPRPATRLRAYCSRRTPVQLSVVRRAREYCFNRRMPCPFHRWRVFVGHK
jgi:hypothetical protein